MKNQAKTCKYRFSPQDDLQTAYTAPTTVWDSTTVNFAVVTLKRAQMSRHLSAGAATRPEATLKAGSLTQSEACFFF